MELQQLISDIHRTRLMGNPPGNPNYRLMSLIADLVEYVGRHEDAIPEVIDIHLCALVCEHDTALFYRQVEHLRQAGSNSKRRLEQLQRGLKLFKIDLKVVLLRTPRLPTHHISHMIA